MVCFSLFCICKISNFNDDSVLFHLSFLAIDGQLKSLDSDFSVLAFVRGSSQQDQPRLNGLSVCQGGGGGGAPLLRYRR